MPSSILLLASVVAGSLAMQDQIGAPAVQAAVPEESVRLAQSHLERGEALSEARDYTAAIEAYSSAIRAESELRRGLQRPRVRPLPAWGR